MTPPRLNLLFLITAHRQLIEFEYAMRFFERFFQSNLDLYVHHHGLHDLSGIAFPPRTRLQLSPANRGGHELGGLEAVDEVLRENDFSQYDYVIHHHPDVFFTSERKLLRLLDTHLHNDNAFLITKSYDFPRFYDFDFFAFKPKLLTTNIFRDWESWREFPEYYLHDKIHEHGLPHAVVPRFESDFGQPKRIDVNGVWHEHTLKSVKQYLDDKTWMSPAVTLCRSHVPDKVSGV